MKKQKLVCGIGVNDADYNVYTTCTVDGKLKILGICPFYRKWADMLCRAYSKREHKRNPTYVGCSAVPEWHYFMNFRAWMEKQDWEGKQLDKDILFPNNKTYGPDTCVFVDQSINKFLTERSAARGEWPIGVDFHKSSGKYRARCWDVEEGKNRYLGLFDHAEEAHKVWLTFKLEQAKILASQQTDERVAKALVERYKNYVLS